MYIIIGLINTIMSKKSKSREWTFNGKLDMLWSPPMCYYTAKCQKLIFSNIHIF